VSWKVYLYATVAMSATEFEYMAVAKAAEEALGQNSFWS
jgi:hypothetical protein